MKKHNTTNLVMSLLVMMTFGLVWSCDDDTAQAISNNLRLLTATANGEDIKNEMLVIDNEGLVIELVFSHTINTTALEDALTISGNPSYTVSYDESSSFATLTFDDLAFETDYTLILAAGDYSNEADPLQEGFELHFTTSPYIPPIVTLSAGSLSLLEGESTQVTAKINESSASDVTVVLSFAGTATLDTDYELSASPIIIPSGSLSMSVDLLLKNDSETEGEETLTISIESIENAVESGTQSLNFSFQDELPSLELKGVMALRWTSETDGNSGKAVHLVALDDIADLSLFSLGVANNGGGTDSIEFNLPSIAVSKGADILVARDPAALEAYFGGCYTSFEHVIQTDEMAQNGDDAIELYKGTAVIETYGDPDVDGTDQNWEYSSSWAYKLGDTWISGLVNCTGGSNTTLDSECIYPLCDNPLVLKGVLAILWDGSGTNGGKAIHLVVNSDIADLSIYSIGVANNGGGTDGIEFSLPSMALKEGEHVLLAREVNTISTYFGNCFEGFDQVIETDAMNQNGDDAIELFNGTTVIETYGDVDVDGSGEVWDYTGSWAYKIGSKWTYGGVDCAATSTTNATSDCVYSFCE
ncbi:MAG: hypothetical protein RIC35_09860 [Marinoscillum sp.]